MSDFLSGNRVYDRACVLRAGSIRVFRGVKRAERVLSSLTTILVVIRVEDGVTVAHRCEDPREYGTYKSSGIRAAIVHG